MLAAQLKPCPFNSDLDISGTLPEKLAWARCAAG